MTGAVLDGTNLKVTECRNRKTSGDNQKTERKTGVDFTQEFTVIVKPQITQSNRSAGADPGGHGPVYRRKRGSCSESKDAVKEEPAIS